MFITSRIVSSTQKLTAVKSWGKILLAVIRYKLASIALHAWRALISNIIFSSMTEQTQQLIIMQATFKLSVTMKQTYSEEFRN